MYSKFTFSLAISVKIIHLYYLFHVRVDLYALIEQKGNVFWLFFSPFLFPPNTKEKKKKRMNNQSRGKK